MYSKYVKLKDTKGVRDSDVAKATGIPPSTFSDWKKGKSQPKIDKLYKIADYFEVPISELISEEDNLSSFARFAVLSNELEDSFFKLDDMDQQTILAMMKVMLQGEKYADREKR